MSIPIIKTLKSAHDRLYNWRFELLLTALVTVFVINILFPENIYGGMAQAIYLPFLLLASCSVFSSKKLILYVIGLVAILLIGSRILNLFFAKNIENEMALLYICFFGSVFVEVVRQIYSTPLVSGKIVMAAISGLLLIGFCGFYIFLAIEFQQPGSFSNLSQGIEATNDLFYFSFITILTVGYGHITPVSWIAKNATVLIALLAYVYSWVVIATIVGEATSNKAARRSMAAAQSGDQQVTASTGSTGKKNDANSL